MKQGRLSENYIIAKYYNKRFKIYILWLGVLVNVH